MNFISYERRCKRVLHIDVYFRLIIRKELISNLASFDLQEPFSFGKKKLELNPADNADNVTGNFAWLCPTRIHIYFECIYISQVHKWQCSRRLPLSMRIVYVCLEDLVLVLVSRNTHLQDNYLDSRLYWYTYRIEIQRR